MNPPVKLLLDLCLGHTLVADLAHSLASDTPAPVIAHLFSFFSSGKNDSEWIPKISNEGWIVLTADRARKSNVDKLPEICLAYKVTHILMGPSVVKLKQHQKANAIVAAWDEIKKCAAAPKGSRFAMQIGPSGKPFIKQSDCGPVL